MGVKIDTHEVCHHIDILDGHCINIVKDVLAPYEAIASFEEKFPGTRRCSPNLMNYINMSMHADLEAVKCKKRCEVEIKRKFAGCVLSGN